MMLFLIPNFLLGDPGYASVHLTQFVILLAVIELESAFFFLRRHAVPTAAPQLLSLSALWLHT